MFPQFISIVQRWDSLFADVLIRLRQIPELSGPENEKKQRRAIGKVSGKIRSSLVVTILEFLRFGLKIAEGFYPDPNHPRIRTLKTAIDLFT